MFKQAELKVYTVCKNVGDRKCQKIILDINNNLHFNTTNTTLFLLAVATAIAGIVHLYIPL